MIDDLGAVENGGVGQLGMRPRREDIQHQPGILPVEQIVANVAADAGLVFLGLSFARDLVGTIPVMAATEIEDAETVGVDMRALRVGPWLSRAELGITLRRAFGAKTNAAEGEGRGDDSKAELGERKGRGQAGREKQ